MIQTRTSTKRATVMPFRSGQIILVSYPFSDHTSAKLRPALVVSGDRFNEGEDFVALPLSSRINKDDEFGYSIFDTDSFFRDTGLRCSSSVKWTKPMTISKVVVKRRLGEVPDAVLREIQTKTQSLFS